jgi:ribosomal protein L40E
VADEPIDITKAREERADRHMLVPCARCGAQIPMHATQCPKCRVHFDGEAFQFTYERASQNPPSSRPALWLSLGVIFIILFAALLYYLMGTGFSR